MAPTPTSQPTQAPQPTPTPGQAITSTKAEITLAGSSAYPAATGRARFEINGANRLLETEVKNVPALKGTTLDVFVGGSKVGSMVVGDNGGAKLGLYTDKGATTVPTSAAGKVLEVKTGGGALVAFGKFP